MESNELLASLAKMEASLNEVDSARKQVQSAVDASLELQKVVREYVSAVKALSVSLQSWEDDLREREGHLSHEYEEAISRVNSTCNEIINSFGAEVEKTSTDFNNKTNPVIERFTEQIGKLENHVHDLNALREEIKKTTGEIESVKETLTQISKDLKESQEQQDEVLNDIKLKDEEIKNEVDAINSELSNVKSDCHSILTATSEIKKTVQSSTEQLTKSINDFQAFTAKSININRWIIIVGVILLAALRFLVK